MILLFIKNVQRGCRSPVQVNPSPMYPGRQAQATPPAVLVQLASALQPPLFVAHSLISAISLRFVNIFNKNYIIQSEPKSKLLYCGL